MELMARELPFESVEDAAWFNAILRALESCGPEPLFQDPIVKHVKSKDVDAMLRFFRRNPSFDRRGAARRTRAMDDQVRRVLRESRVDAVLNLGAGWDTRPLRMDLPSKLRWVEADLPRLIERKERLLHAEKASCRLERRGVDLRDAAARRGLFDELGRTARSVLVLTEAVLMYFPEEQVGALARELHDRPRFARWLTDLLTPDGVRAIAEAYGEQLRRADAWVHFGPEEGSAYFAAHGWEDEARGPRRRSLGARIRSWFSPLPGGTDAGIVSLVRRP